MTQQHYRMTLEEAIAQYKCGLISSTALLYYFLKIRLKPGWKITLHQREISKELGISRDQFYRGIQRLKDRKLLDWEAPNGLVVSLDKTATSGQNCDAVDKTATSEQNCYAVNKTATAVDKTATAVDKTATAVDKTATTTLPKPAPDKASSLPSDYYQIFIKSLSEGEREKFLDFVREKIKDFPKPINDLEGWLAGLNQAGQYRFRVYYEMFQSEVGEGVAPSADWESHPKWQQALAAMRTGVPRFIVLGEPGCEDIDKPTRQAMADYAEAKNLIWGAPS